jgi:hypothetical protein
LCVAKGKAPPLGGAANSGAFADERASNSRATLFSTEIMGGRPVLSGKSPNAQGRVQRPTMTI